MAHVRMWNARARLDDALHARDMQSVSHLLMTEWFSDQRSEISTAFDEHSLPLSQLMIEALPTRPAGSRPAVSAPDVTPAIAELQETLDAPALTPTQAEPEPESSLVETALPAVAPAFCVATGCSAIAPSTSHIFCRSCAGSPGWWLWIKQAVASVCDVFRSLSFDLMRLLP